jgi:hypothetical protein
MDFQKLLNMKKDELLEKILEDFSIDQIFDYMKEKLIDKKKIIKEILNKNFEKKDLKNMYLINLKMKEYEEKKTPEILNLEKNLYSYDDEKKLVLDKEILKKLYELKINT